MIELFSKEIEEAVLGEIMLEGDSLTMVVNHIPSSDYFYFDKHKYIYEAILRLYNRGDSIDMLTVTNEIKEKSQLIEVGGAYFVADLTTKTNSASNIIHHCFVLKELCVKRKLHIHYIKEIQLMNQDGYDIFNALERYELLNNEINNITIGDTLKHIKETLEDSDRYIQESQDNLMNGNIGKSIDFGIKELSGILKLKAGNLIIIGGRPSMGKTALLIAMANEISYNTPLGIISLEMTALEMTNRFISYNTHITTWAMENKILPKEAIGKIREAIKYIKNKGIYIDDKARMNIGQIRARAYYLKQRYNIGVLFIDYLGIIDMGKHFNMNNALGVITRELKILAKELGIPIIVLSQLSRDGEKEKRKPKLSDLRDSGAIEQDADIVIFPYRPEKYEITHYEDGTPTANTAQIIIAKNRSGGICDILMPCNIKYNHFGTPMNDNPIYSTYDIDAKSGEISSKINNTLENFDSPF